MVAAATTLKFLYPKPLRGICAADLLHNFAMKVKSHSEDVDQLIAKFKLPRVKHKAGKCVSICCLPQLIVTK